MRFNVQVSTETERSRELCAYKVAPDEMTPQERAYMATSKRNRRKWMICWRVIGAGPDGVLDTVYGNSEDDALVRAKQAGLVPIWEMAYPS